MKIIDFPLSGLHDVAAGVRAIAEGIERGDYGDAHNVAWVIDCGAGRVEVGFLGRAPGSAGADAHLLLAIGQRMLEDGARGAK